MPLMLATHPLTCTDCGREIPAGDWVDLSTTGTTHKACGEKAA